MERKRKVSEYKALKDREEEERQLEEMEQLKAEAEEKRLVSAELTARYRHRVRLFVSDNDTTVVVATCVLCVDLSHFVFNETHRTADLL